MRFIRHLLFTFLISIISIDIVYAADISCTYKNSGTGTGDWTWICDVSLNDGVKCHTTDTKNTYVYGSGGTIDDITDLKPSNFIDDNEEGTLSCAALPNIKLDTYTSGDGKTHVDKITAYGSCPSSEACTTFTLDDNITKYNIGDYAGYCLYGDENHYQVCGVTYVDEKFECRYGGSYVGSGGILYNQYKNKLEMNDFIINDGSIFCPSSLNLCYTNVEGYSVIENASTAACSSAYSTINLKLSDKKMGDVITYDYEKDPEYIAAKKDRDQYCNELDYSETKCNAALETMANIKETYQNGGPQSPSTPTPSDPETPTTFDKDHFCEGGVLKVARAAGWLFIIAKIIIPILLIVFGSIDFGKAVIASKEDEIKKQAKVLTFRAISGIIIFFIPNIINFAVTTIGGSDVYNGSEFGACTECILDPNAESCENIEE